MSTYERFLDSEVMEDISESDEERIMFIEEETDDCAAADNGGSDEVGGSTTMAKRGRSSSRRRRCSVRMFKSPAVVVPTMMTLDLILGVSLSLYDSNLLRNVPGFRFPLCYALTQKLTNALASLVLICIARRWEAEDVARRHPPVKNGDDGTAAAAAAAATSTMTGLPSARSLRRHAAPLAAAALAQAISASFANRALQSIPLPLFKVCLMCGPIFVALATSAMGGGGTGVVAHYTGGRSLALCLIGAGAIRAVCAEVGSADDPRGVMAGAGCALGASAFSGMGLVLSGVLMHRREGGGRRRGVGWGRRWRCSGGGDEQWESEYRGGRRGAEPVIAPVLSQLQPGAHARRLPVPVGRLLHATGRGGGGGTDGGKSGRTL